MNRSIAPAAALLVPLLLLHPAAPAAAEAAEPPRLSLPVACAAGRDCFVQNHVDLDPSPAVRDFACGAATYDGHKGVDFRLSSTAAAVVGVKVLAAAPGVVKGVRDGMDDLLLRQQEPGTGGLAGRECGNGVVVDHGGGWETQYCHMRRGSLAVRTGATVARGEPLGEVGYSGFADFAHLHFAVRRNGAVVDPFSGGGVGAPCRGDAGPGGGRGTGLWEADVAAAFPYARGTFIDSGFAAAIPTTLQLEQGGDSIPAAGPESDGFVFYARAMNAMKGDKIRIRVTGPGTFEVAAEGQPLDRDKAVAVQAAGRKRSWRRWPPGRYEGRAELVRAGAVVTEIRGAFEMP